jgi:hypothetical protein
MARLLLLALLSVPAFAQELKHDLDPHPTNISPEVVWNDLPGLLNSLGRANALSSGETRLVLPSPARRRITMLYPDGRPAVGADVQVSVCLYDYNHCAAAGTE